MKNFVTTVLFLAVPILGYCQVFEIEIPALLDIPTNSSGSVEFQKVLEFDADQNKLYGIALKYIADTYRDANAVTQVNDPSNGLAIAKGTFESRLTSYNGLRRDYQEDPTTVYHTLSIETKNNRIRVTINGFSVKTMFGNTYQIESILKDANDFYSLSNPTKKDKRFQLNDVTILNNLNDQMDVLIADIQSFYIKELNNDW